MIFWDDDDIDEYGMPSISMSEASDGGGTWEIAENSCALSELVYGMEIGILEGSRMVS